MGQIAEPAPKISLNYTGTTIEITVSQNLNGLNGNNHWDSSTIEWTYEGETWAEEGFSRRTNFNSYTWVFEIADSSWYYNPFHIWFRVCSQHADGSSSDWGYADIDNISYKAAPSSPPTLSLKDNGNNTATVSWNWNEAPDNCQWDEVAVEYQFANEGSNWPYSQRTYVAKQSNISSCTFNIKETNNNSQARVRAYAQNTSGSSEWSSVVSTQVKYYTSPGMPTNCQFHVHEIEHTWEIVGKIGSSGINNLAKSVQYQRWNPKIEQYVDYDKAIPYTINDNNTQVWGRARTVGSHQVSSFAYSNWVEFSTTLKYYEDLTPPQISISLEKNILALSYPQPTNKLNNNVKSVYIEWGTSTSAATLPTIFTPYSAPIKLEQKLDKQYIFVRGITKGTHHDSVYSDNQIEQFNYSGFVLVWDVNTKTWVSKTVYIYNNNTWQSIEDIQVL